MRHQEKDKIITLKKVKDCQNNKNECHDHNLDMTKGLPRV